MRQWLELLLTKLKKRALHWCDHLYHVCEVDINYICACNLWKKILFESIAFNSNRGFEKLSLQEIIHS